MRKDAKIGFAIGGVLLAVLTVYATVVTKHTKKPTGTVAVVTPPVDAPAPTPVTPGPTMIASGDGTATTVAKDPIPAPGPVATGNTPDGGSVPALLPLDTAKPEDQKPPKNGDNLVVDNGPLVTPPPVEPRTVKTNKVKPLKLETTEAAPATDRVYVVQSGQTLSSIATEIYGNPRFWVAIQRENKSINANHLKVGEKINLPDITPLRPTAVDDVIIPDAVARVSHTVVAPVPAATTDARTYIVKAGDSLYKIARTILGSGRKADAIYDLNKVVIGPDKTRLKQGMVLKLPERAVVGLADSRGIR